MSLLRDGLHDVMEVVLSLDFTLDKSWYDAKTLFPRFHAIKTNIIRPGDLLLELRFVS